MAYQHIMHSGFVRAAMGSTMNTIHRNEQLWDQLKKLPNAGREGLNALVSGRMRVTASADKRGGPQRVENPCGSRPPSNQAGTPAVEFGPLDPNIISDSIPAFFVGRNRDGLWVLRDSKGRVGGLFMLRSSALVFAHEQGGAAGCATIFTSDRIELDLKNEGNPLASYLAPLLRLGNLCRMIRGAA
jgi:hypothetical protein